MSNDFTGKEETLVPGKLRGYRNWFVDLDTITLAPITSNSQRSWVSGINYASCRIIKKNSDEYSFHSDENDIPPSAGCTCGFYAKYLSDELFQFFGSVSGAIDAHGKIQLGSSGFRCERAEIVALAPKVGLPSRGNLGVLREIASQYGVPWFDSMDDLLKEFPPSDVSELAPKEEYNYPPIGSVVGYGGGPYPGYPIVSGGGVGGTVYIQLYPGQSPVPISPWANGISFMTNNSSYTSHHTRSYITWD